VAVYFLVLLIKCCSIIKAQETFGQISAMTMFAIGTNRCAKGGLTEILILEVT
jgi:hypothetical protein